MENLPSFVDLMNSLGLEDKVAPLPSSRPRPRPNGSGHRRAYSDTSSSTLDNDLELLKRRRSPALRAYSPNHLFVPPGDQDIRLSRHVKERYSPYGTVSLRNRVSMPSLNEHEASPPNRATSTSPLHTIGCAGPIRASSRTSRSRSGSQSSWTSETLQPISAYARRKGPRSPSASPTVATFPTAIREPYAPVALPALLPPILFQPHSTPDVLSLPTLSPCSSRSSLSERDELEPMEDDEKPTSFAIPRLLIVE
ncbi:hypothetical protein PENSPDRAFT_727224 [Peniophora sp. CONT]|nr:hypothetical protein PENSPDRAFT_727224 [Peniophora sp. CONT]